MTTASMQLKVQRGRFAQHLWTAFSNAVPAAMHDWLMPQAAPVVAVQTAAREAQEVRKLAQTYAHSDPGFASDLYAAAARHEGLHGN